MMITKDYFFSLADWFIALRKSGEHIFFDLHFEESQFVRFNGAKVRQTGTVEDAILGVALVTESPRRRVYLSTGITGNQARDHEHLKLSLSKMRVTLEGLPEDPYASVPENHGSTEVEKKGSLLPIGNVVDSVLSKTTEKADLVGIYTSGPVTEAMANSAGQRHWFRTETFNFDYSLFTVGEKALKSSYAGQSWNQSEYEAQIRRDLKQLESLVRPSKKVVRGQYRVYLAPAATDALMAMFAGGTVGEAEIRQGESCLRRVRSGEKRFSRKFTLLEDYRSGVVPRFNSLGEVAPEMLEIIGGGEIKHTLVSTRTSKEYGVAANGASHTENMRAPRLVGGALSESEILNKLGTGLYLSNLHYLNWSDQVTGRVTGMTRYACFYVENGEVVAPIENMRWDDSLFDLFGGNLEDLTKDEKYIPEGSTYFARSLGGSVVPGVLLSSMDFTL